MSKTLVVKSWVFDILLTVTAVFMLGTLIDH